MTYQNSSYIDHKLERILGPHLDHVLAYKADLNQSCVASSPIKNSKAYLVTATFRPTEAILASDGPIPIKKCFRQFEQFYVRMLSNLMNNYTRKRHLQPLTYAYIDFPHTKIRKHKHSSRPLSRNLLPQELTAHIHAIMVMHPTLVDDFDGKAFELKRLYSDLSAINESLNIRFLSTDDDIKRALFYSANLMANVPPELRGEDLYIMLPKASSELAYAKSHLEKELELKLVTDRAFRDRHRHGLFA